MIRQDRAKQFAPFEALKGLREALARKEREYEKEEKREVLEEEAEQIEQELTKLQPGDNVEILCYEDGFYIRVKGRVEKIDVIFKYIVVGKGKVFFDDLYEIRKI